MCDYSLDNVASRPAKISDPLVTTRFANTTTRGFAAIGEPDVAICLPPGTEIGFASEVEYRNPLARLFCGFERETEVHPYLGRLFSGLRLAPGKVARFRQVNQDDPHRHHDALEFADGTIVLLTQLPPDVQNSSLADRQQASAASVDVAFAL